MSENKDPNEVEFKIPDLSKLDFRSETYFPTTGALSNFPQSREDIGVEGKAKMVWMNESAVVTPESETPIVGTRSLADCLGIGVCEEDAHIAGADHMRFDATYDPEGDNIGYAYGRAIHLVNKVLEKGGKSVVIYFVNMEPMIRGEARNKRLRRVLENAIKDKRVADKIKKVEWFNHAEGFQIDSRNGKFSCY